MPEHLKALVVILVLATTVFAFAKAPACGSATDTGDFERRRNLWFAITLTAFLAHNFWIYIVVVAALVLFTLPREPNKLAMFFLLLYAVPPVHGQIPAFGGIDHLFNIDYIRLLSLTILLPAFVSLMNQPDGKRFGRSVPDVLLAAYLIFLFFLQLTHNTFTNALRHGVFYAFTDVFLPYYVASRSVRNLDGFRETIMAFAVAALVLSAIGAFEFVKKWLLYSALINALGMTWGYGIYLPRGDSLRAHATTGQALAFGFVMAVAIGLFRYLRKVVPNPKAWGLGLLLLAIGLIAPVSRGPWVGSAAILLVFIATGPNPGPRFLKLGLLAAIVVPVLLASPAGDTIIDHLPFVGTIDERNVTYRQRLLDVSVEIILANPWFGAPDFLESLAMMDMTLGDGLIDIVNSYVGIALSTGLVSLSLFCGFFIAVVVSVFMSMRTISDKNDENHLLGQVLLSTLLGILLMIFTVSSITVIPVTYWSVAGLGVAYVRMIAKRKKDAVPPALDSFWPTNARNWQ